MDTFSVYFFCRNDFLSVINEMIDLLSSHSKKTRTANLLTGYKSCKPFSK